MQNWCYKSVFVSFRLLVPIWPQKTLPICYKDLTNYAVTIDLWKISAYTFNTLYASTTFSLQDVVDMDPDSTVMLQRKLPNKKRSYEVQRLKVQIVLFFLLLVSQFAGVLST